jgi:outer membrane protein assembly factor BamB
MSRRVSPSRRSFLASTAGGLASVGLFGGVLGTVDTVRAQKASPDDDWRQYRGDAGHTSSVLDGSGPTGNIRKAWTSSAGYATNADVVVVGETVYIAGTTLVAANAADGSERWKFNPKPPASEKESTPHIRTPAVVDGTVYASVGFGPYDTSGERDSALIAVDAATGKRRWRIDTKGAVGGDPSPVTVAHDTVFATLPGKPLTAYTTDGSVRWKWSSKGKAWGPGPVSGGRMYLGGKSGVRALDVATGEVVWEALPQVANVYASMVSNGMLFVTESSQPGVTLIALDAATGDEYWRTAYVSDKTKDNPVLGVGTADTDTVYIQTDVVKGYVIALNRTNGNERWRSLISDARHYFGSNLARVGDLLYVGSSALNPVDGSSVWEYSISGTPLGVYLSAVAGGRCYLVGGDVAGTLYVLAGTTDGNTQPTQSTATPTTDTPTQTQTLTRTTDMPTQTPSPTPTQTPTQTRTPAPTKTATAQPSPTEKMNSSDVTPMTEYPSQNTADAQTATGDATEETTTMFGPGFGVLTTVAGVGLGAWRYIQD